MNGNKLLLDTNAILYLLNGDKDIADVIHGKLVYLSFVSEMELLGFPDISQNEENSIKQFLEDATTKVIDINTNIKENAITLRRKYKIKLPDSIIMGTAQFLDIPVLTADKDFEKVNEINLILFEN